MSRHLTKVATRRPCLVLACVAGFQWRAVSLNPSGSSSGCTTARGSTRATRTVEPEPIRRGMVFATVAITVLSVVMWAHHKYATGPYPYHFCIERTVNRLRLGSKFFNWIGAMPARSANIPGAEAVFARLFNDVPPQRPSRGACRAAGHRLALPRYLFRGGTLPLRTLWHHRVRHLRWDLFLASQDCRADAG